MGILAANMPAADVPAIDVPAVNVPEAGKWEIPVNNNWLLNGS